MHRTEIARQMWGSQVTAELWVLTVVTSCHTSGVWNLKVSCRILERLWTCGLRTYVCAFEGSIEVMTSLNGVVVFAVKQMFVIRSDKTGCFSALYRAAFWRHRSRMLFKTDVCVWRNNLYKERIFWRAFFCTSTNQHENAREMCKAFHIKLFFRCNKSNLFPCVQVISKHKNKLLFLSAGSSTCREAIAGTLPCRMITSYVSKRK
jgi:hypothetical protein